MQRSLQKRINRRAQIVRYMRLEKKMSMRHVAEAIGVCDSYIAHIEMGRMGICDSLLAKLLGVYGYSLEEFEQFSEQKTAPIQARMECISILKQLNESKIQAVYPLLLQFSDRIPQEVQ